jgi:hypothetical protein
MEGLDELFKEKNNRMAMCLEFTSPSDAPSWTLPGHSTLTLLYIFAGVYLTAIMGAMLLPSCCCFKREPVSGSTASQDLAV